MQQRQGRENVATLSTNASGGGAICLKRYEQFLPMTHGSRKSGRILQISDKLVI